MNTTEALHKIERVRGLLLGIKEITSFITLDLFEKDEETGNSRLEGNDSMLKLYPEKGTEVSRHWSEIQRMVPPGFSIDSNLVRHLSFNEAKDWFDIWHNDIPREIVRVEEYKKRITLIEFLDTLHPEVRRVTSIILDGDIDAALKTVYTSLDAKIRTSLNAHDDSESTVPLIGRAFKEGWLTSPSEAHRDAVRNFLQGVLGYYRSRIIHHTLSPKRNSVEASLSLFCLAHEALWLFDSCNREAIQARGSSN